MIFFKLVDGGVYSYQVKICKPNLRIYEELLQRYNLVPEETIFIDDVEENVNVARKLKIHGVVFRNLEQTKREVEKMIL